MAKKVNRATRPILGFSPKPNQMITSGARATIGSVCEATISG